MYVQTVHIEINETPSIKCKLRVHELIENSLLDTRLMSLEYEKKYEEMDSIWEIINVMTEI